MRQRTINGLWALGSGLVVGAISASLPQATLARDLWAGTVACLVAIVVLTFAPRAISWDRRGSTFNLHFIWPFGSKLKRDSVQLAKRLRDYLKDHPLPPVTTWEGITNFHKPEDFQAWRQTMRECEELFGADARVIAEQYHGRGMLDKTETRHLPYSCTDLLHMAVAASQIEALARRL
jgi:hypothetical protein